MNLTILKIILWPKDTSLNPRIIKFLPDRINIISGESGSGKSALTSIVDYCLGSSKCSIPVGIIRNLTSWFGLHIRLMNTEMIVARRNPETRQITSDLYWEEGLSLTVPSEIVKNARVQDLKNRFNQIAYLPSLNLKPGDNVGYAGRPSFRDMAAFNFQPQHIVANPYTFFYKADTTEHREKLRFVFPLVLGVVDANALLKQQELRQLESERHRLERELRARLDAALAWEAEIESYYMQARAFGLLPDSPSLGVKLPLDKYILELQRVPEMVRELDLPDFKEGTSEDSVAEFAALIREEDQLAREIGSMRRRLSKLDLLSTSFTSYGTDLTDQEDRIKNTGWLSNKLSNSYRCPVCSAEHPEGNKHLAELRILADELAVLTDSIYQAPAVLDKETSGLREQLRVRERKISNARQKRKYLEDKSAELAAERQRIRQIYLFVGRVEQALENLSVSSNVSNLQENIALLRQRIDDLKQDLDPQSKSNRLREAVQSVSTRISNYAHILHLEHTETNIGLNLKELTLQFGRLSGRKDYLWEIGSGQNWVGYHIATLLALHEHFMCRPNNPVPRFLMIDQPSQVYFPEAWPSIDTIPDSKKDNPTMSSDIEGVRRIFYALSAFLEAVEGIFQVIVTDHAGAITWEGVPFIHVVEDWHKGHDEFLIPDSWQEGERAD